ncbi:MAG: hypothetical protein P8R42_22585 [Candidatus Binatia bacterium]|nr:hypothetical protein [Candidatus Binatia bacterium]
MLRNTQIAGVAVTGLLAGAVASPVRDEESAGAANSVEAGIQKAGTESKNGLDTAGRATGNALDKAMEETGKGVGYAIDKTGEGFKKAGDSMTGTGTSDAD